MKQNQAALWQWTIPEKAKQGDEDVEFPGVLNEEIVSGISWG